MPAIDAIVLVSRYCAIVFVLFFLLKKKFDLQSLNKKLFAFFASLIWWKDAILNGEALLGFGMA